MGFQKGNKHAFPKGKPGNPNGRPKGTPNKTTKEMKEIMMLVLSKHLPRLDEYIENMSDYNKVNALDKIAKYVLPTLSKSEIDGNIDVDGNVTIEVVYGNRNGDDNSNSFDSDDLNED